MSDNTRIATLTDAATVDFEPVDVDSFLERIDETMKATAIELRLAGTIVKKSKADLIGAVLKTRAANKSPDFLFDELEAFDQRLIDLDRMVKLLTAARTRMFVAMSVVAAEPQPQA